MSFQAGRKLAHYEILEPIGKGGMGEVYRAKDGKLGRDVAIKVLPDEFAEDEERLRRFQREAKVLASLNHPNIASIYGLEQSGETHYLVLELVPGETLAERLARGPIPVDEALDIAIKIAEALEEAHEQGIVHRDLKPANVKLTPDGKVKVLDFGLAKAFVEEGPEGDVVTSLSPTITRDATRLGVILGTAAYMSPEQAKGKRIDKRTDIFAFGSVVFEMLTGKRAFSGEDVSDVLAAILKTDPDWGLLPKGLHARVRNLLSRCLEKDVKRRRRDIGDVKLEIEEALADDEKDDQFAGTTRAHHFRPVVVSIVATALVVGLFAWMLARSSAAPDSPVTRFVVTLDASDGFVSQYGMAVSSDGRRLVVAASRDGVQQLFVRERDRLELTPVDGTENAIHPFLSPDGTSVGFFTGTALKKARLSGGGAVTLCEAQGRRGGSWGPGDMIVFGSDTHAGLMRISANGGEPKPLTTPSPGERHSWPELLPDGTGVVFTVSESLSLTDSRVAVLSLETGEWNVLTQGSDASMTPGGHLIFGRPGSLWAAPFDIDRLELIGEPVQVIEGVQVNLGGWAQYALAADGTLVYLGDGQGYPSSRFAWVERSGEASSPLMAIPAHGSPRLSPDGNRLAVSQLNLDEGGADIWVWDLDRGAGSPVTVNGHAHQPEWSPDGTQLAFDLDVDDGGLFSMPADGSGTPQRLTESDPRSQRVEAWTSDGQAIIFSKYLGDGGHDLFVLPLDGEPRPLLVTEFNEYGARVSRDGRWFAYTSDRSGVTEVYVRPFPGPGGAIPISSGGGAEPLWSPDGRELFYRNGDRMMVVGFQAGETFTPERPRELFQAPYGHASWNAGYDVSPDGERFLMQLNPGEGSSGVTLTVVLNWPEELERLVPTDN